MQRRAGLERDSSLIQEVTSSGRFRHRQDNVVNLVFLLLADGSRHVADYLFPILELGTMFSLQVIVIHQPRVRSAAPVGGNQLTETET
jgi:hypothetical protein